MQTMIGSKHLTLKSIPLDHEHPEGCEFSVHKEAYNEIAGRRLLAPAKTYNKIASWGDLGACKVFIG